MLLDAVLGEPRWLWSRLPHPVVLMGRLIGRLDTYLNSDSARRAKGVFAVTLLLLVGLFAGLLLQAIPGKVAEIILGGILLAQRSLADHVRAVADALRISLEDGRNMVGRIVGRDTTAMTGPDVARAAIESAAENLSDGVIAPVFWMALGGLPGLLCYKLINTADSMIGYRTPRHEAFGWAAARLDDLLNWIPARLTAVLIWLTRPRLSHVRDILLDAPRHRSPNAGWPEAAIAQRLGIALAGPRTYDGVRQDFTFVNNAGAKDVGPNEIDRTVAILWWTWALALAGVLFVAILA